MHHLAVSSCQYLAGCHPHHVNNIHKGGFGGLGVLLFLVFIAFLYDRVKNGANG